LTVHDALASFIIDQRLKGNTDKTIIGYQRFIRLFASWLATKEVVDISDITITHVKEYQLYINDKPAERRGGDKLTKRSIQTYMRHIKVFLTYCHAEDFILEPLHLKVKTPKAEVPVVEILTDEEIDIIMSTFTKSETGLRNRAIISILLDCGLRLSEVVGIETENINFEKGYVKVLGKGRKERIVPLGLKVRRAMLAYVHKRRVADTAEDDRYFFLSKARQPITSHCISSLMRRLKKRTGISRLHVHLFRHTFATNFLVHRIGDVYELSRILGHSAIRVTEIYLQLASYYTIIEKKGRVSYLDMKR